MSGMLNAQAQLLLAEIGWKSRPMGTIGVTSSHRREGVSTIAAALAQAAAPQGDDVLLADFCRRPEGRPRAQPPEDCDLVQEHVDDLLGIPTSTEGLFTLNYDQFSERLGGRSLESNLEQLLPKLRERYALCIFDLPPVLDDARGAALAAKLDTTVIVIRSGHTTVEDVRRAERVLSKNGASLSGAVLNRCRD